MVISKAIYLGNESCLSSAMGEGEAEGVLESWISRSA